LTIIFDNTEFWIEYHEISAIAIAAASGFDTVINLDRAGRCVGISCTVGRANNTPLLSCRAFAGAGTSITHGIYITQFSLGISNNSAATAETAASAYAVVFMRR